jgi:beta-lactam-binding protein with PASTA domain
VTDAGIECASCGYMAPPGSNRCPNCNAPLRIGGNRTQVLRRVDVTDVQPATGPDAASRRDDVQPARDAGRFTIAVREPDGDYEPGRVLECRAVPGTELLLVARVHNQTRVVDNFDVAVVGLPEDWCSVKPETVYLTPRDAGRGVYEQQVDVRITVPRSPQAAAGDRAVSIVAVSRATGARQAADLTLSIEPFAKLTAALRPAELRSRYRARTRLSVKNEGNGPADVKLTGTDPTGKLRFKFTPVELRVVDEDEARVEVRAPRRVWIGQPKTHQFSVEAKAATGEGAVSQDGRLDHRPYMRPWVLLLVPLIVAAVAWYLQRPEQGTVPLVKGKRVSEAALLVTKAGLRPEFKALPPDPQSGPAPRVLDQSPAPGDKIDVDKPVLIIFETGSGTAAVPGVVGHTVKEARAILEPRFQLGQVMPLNAPPNGRIEVQEPAAGQRADLRTPVSVTLDAAKKITAGTVVGAGSKASPTPTQAAKGQLAEPLAYSDGHQVLLKKPETGATPIAGDDKSENTDPTWNPADGSIAYVHALSPTSSEIRVIKPDKPRTDHAITGRDKRYRALAYSPKGTLLAMIEADDPDFGGRLCLMAAGGNPTCWDDDQFFYYRPVWGDETTLYVLRREKESDQAGGWTQIARFTAEEPGGTTADGWAVDAKPVVSADVLSLATGSDGRIAALTRKSADDDYSISLYDGDGTVLATQPPGFQLCQLSWSGPDLVAAAEGCEKGSNAPSKILKYNVDRLTPNGEFVVKGQDPALAPAG